MYELSVYLHIISAMGWVGGMLHAVGQRFRVVGWVLVTILIITGIINAGYRGVRWESIASGALFATTFGQILTLKVVVVVAMVALTALHDFVVGPATTRALMQEATGATVGRLRRQGSWLARVSLLLALAIVALAVTLVRGLPW